MKGPRGRGFGLGVPGTASGLTAAETRRPGPDQPVSIATAPPRGPDGRSGSCGCGRVGRDLLLPAGAAGAGGCADGAPRALARPVRTESGKSARPCPRPNAQPSKWDSRRGGAGEAAGKKGPFPGGSVVGSRGRAVARAVRQVAPRNHQWRPGSRRPSPTCARRTGIASAVGSAPLPAHSGLREPCPPQRARARTDRHARTHARTHRHTRAHRHTHADAPRQESEHWTGRGAHTPDVCHRSLFLGASPTPANGP